MYDIRVDASMRTRMLPGRTSGIGTSSNRSSPPRRSSRQAFIVMDRLREAVVMHANASIQDTTTHPAFSLRAALPDIPAAHRIVVVPTAWIPAFAGMPSCCPSLRRECQLLRARLLKLRLGPRQWNRFDVDPQRHQISIM